VTTVEPIRVSSGWLDLREHADARARSRDLVRRLRGRLREGDPLVVHDLACGSGSMGRWLAPQLRGLQRWILHDRDPDLLELAAVDSPPGVTVETRLGDVTRLGGGELAGASLVTASALLDLLTEDELRALVDSCAAAGCPVLFTLSVTGRVRLLPPEPLDARLASAFDAHQRRFTPRGRLLGPDAWRTAVELFEARGAEVVSAESPWRLRRAESDLAAGWLTGWVDAACEQEPSLAPAADLYLSRRLREAAAGQLGVTVGHADLLVLP
jgi:hypothetical protein